MLGIIMKTPFNRIVDLMETIISEYAEDIMLLDEELNSTQTFTSLNGDITYTAFKVRLLY